MTQKGQIQILIGILILVIVAGGAYFLGKSNVKPSTPVVSQTSQPTPSLTPDASPAPTGARETANWKTYTDSANGFLFKYPNNWNQVEMATHQIAISPSIPQPFDPSKVFSLSGILITVTSDNDKILDSTQYVNQMVIPVNTYSKNAKITQKLSNIDGVIVEGITGAASGQPSGPSAYITKGTKIMRIDLDSTGIENARDVFDKILSTFKFTN